MTKQLWKNSVETHFPSLQQNVSFHKTFRLYLKWPTCYLWVFLPLRVWLPWMFSYQIKRKLRSFYLFLFNSLPFHPLSDSAKPYNFISGISHGIAFNAMFLIFIWESLTIKKIMHTRTVKVNHFQSLLKLQKQKERGSEVLLKGN